MLYTAVDVLKVRGPLKRSDVVTSSLVVNVVDDDCVHFCHSDASSSTNVSFVVVASSSYNVSDVVVDFGDGVTSHVHPAAAVTRRRNDTAAVSPPPWAAKCYGHGGQASVLWHVYADLGNFTASAYTTVCNATCGRTAALTVGSPQLFSRSLGAVDVRRASVRRMNESAWDVRFIVGVENAAAAGAAGAATLNFDDGTSSPVTLGNASLVSDPVPYSDTWLVGEVKHTYTRPRNYSVSLTIGSQVNQRWTVKADTEVSALRYDVK